MDQQQEETLRSIHAMRRQEECEYFCRDYFHQEEEHNKSSGSASPPSDAVCRQIMFYWMIRVVDFFPSMHRETVAYAMSYLDRFLQTEAGANARRTRSVFQLAAISCLYTSVKIHEHAAVSPKFLEQLSRDEYTVKDVEEMELRILVALKWRLATPTACAFLKHFMDILPPNVLDEKSLQDEIYDLAKFQTEVALGDYKYVSVNKSSIAFCALMNALEAVHVDTRRVAYFVAEAAQIDREYTVQVQTSLALDHADHASLKGSPVSAVYEHTLKSIRCQSPTGYHSPRSVCK